MEQTGAKDIRVHPAVANRRAAPQGIPLSRKGRSGEVVRKRLRLLLVSDEANCSPEPMEMIKDGMIHVISKYMETNSRHMEVGITKMDSPTQAGSIPALYASIPLINLTSKKGMFQMVLFDYNFKRYNFRVILYMLALSFVRVLTIRSATNQDKTMINKQIVGIVAGILLMVVFSPIDYHKLLPLSPVAYIDCVAILGAVLLFGRSKGIAIRQIEFLVIERIQPSEFIKIGLIAFFSWYFQKYQEKINRVPIVAAAALLSAIPILLIIEQPNLSTALVITVIILAMVFTAGISYRRILDVVATMVPCRAMFFYLLKQGIIPFIEKYQANRALTWLNPASDAAGYYQQENSIMTIGSGRLFGKGLSATGIASVKDGDFIIESQTDFIFTITGEELGSVGALVVISLFLILVLEYLFMAYRAKNLSGKFLCTGMAMLFAFQGFANIAVATGLFPNTGLPLPFVNYGVSSLINLYISMGFVVSVGLQRRLDT